MPYDKRHVLAVWGGTLAGGEIWSCSLRLASTGSGPTAPVPTQEDLIGWMESTAKDAVQAFHQRATTKIHVGCKLTFLKMNVITVDGRYEEEGETHEYLYAPVVPGGSSGIMHPTQVALVVSTTTDYTRGHAHRGRFYLPNPALEVDAVDGTISAADANGVAASAGTFIKELADQPGPDPLQTDMKVAVMSRAGAGRTNYVTGVEVGRVLDTQRRRRNALPENYQHVTVSQ